jgi:hypothetical protein
MQSRLIVGHSGLVDNHLLHIGYRSNEVVQGNTG